MKTLITTAILAVFTATSAMAEKKPVDTCAEDVTYAMILYHLDKLEAVLAELEAQAASKPVDDSK